MANDLGAIEIPIVVKDNQLKSAVNTTNRLERELTRLVKAVDSNTVSEERYRQTLIKVGRELKSVTQLTGNQAYGAVVRYTNAKQKQIAATARSQEAIRREADEQRKAAAEQKRVEQATRENTIALNRMRSAYDSSFAVEQRTLELKRRLRQEIANGNMTLRQAGAELLKYRGHMQQFNMAQMAATKTSNRFGVVTQQAGYQIGDFLVQVQSGTNFMVAFGQQATQLVGILPLLAPSGGTFLGLTAKGLIGLSAGLGIAIPLVTALGAAFLRTRPEAEKATTSFEGVKDALDKIEAVNFDKLGNEFLETAKEIREEFSSILGIIEDVARNKLEDSLAAPLKAVIAELESFESRASLAAQIQAVSPDFGGQFGLKSRNEAVFLATQLARLDGETREELQGQLEAISEALFLRGILTDEVKATLVELAGELSLMESITSGAENTVAATQDIADRQGTLREGAQAFLNIWDAITGKIGESVDKIIAANLELKVLNSANRASVKTYGGRGSGAEYNRPAPSGAFVPTQETLDAYNKMMGLSGKAAGSAAAEINELQQEIGRLNETASKGLTPFDKYNKAINHLNELRSEGLSNAAYSMEIERLNEELAKSLPMVNDVADAFGDFLARGLTDFKSFANSIFKSFQNMLAQMIASAARNRILISMGATGSMAGPASAASNLAQGAGMMGGVGTFASSIGTGLSVVGNGFMAGGLSGAATATAGAVSGGIGAGGVAGFGTALGAALPVLAAVAFAVALFRKKTKELDSGLNVTVKNMDALVTSFKTVETSRFFGLSKKTSTSTGGVSSGVSDPIVAAVTQIQQSVLDAAAAFGIGASAFDNFSYKFKLSLKGLSEEQQMQKINEELGKMGDSFASLTGHFASMNELLEAANQRYDIESRLLQALGDESTLLTRQRERELAATHELNRGLLQAVFDLEDANAAVDNAFASLRNSIEAEKNRLRDAFTGIVDGLRERLDVVTESARRSESVFRQLEAALSGRSATSGIGQTFARREGALGFIRGGDFSDEKKLDEALRVVSEPTEDLFGSFVDYARDFARTSLTLEEAKKVAQNQLTADEQQILLLEQQITNANDNLEQQLAALDQQYQIEVDQYNALLGIDTSVKSVGEAIATLRGALEGLSAAQSAAKAAQAAGAGAGVQAANEAGQKILGQLGQSGIAERATDGAKFQRVEVRGSNQLLDIARGLGVQTSGRTGAEIQQAISNAGNLGVNLDNATRAQKFARGGMFGGGMRLVGEEGPELEVTGPARIYSKQQTKDLLKGDNSDGEGLRSEVAEMRQELRQLLIANNKYTKRSYDLYNKWDIDGLPAERT